MNISPELIFGKPNDDGIGDPYERVSFNSFDLSLFFIFITFWLVAYYKSTVASGDPLGFVSSSTLSNIHCIPLCLLSLASLLEWIPETVAAAFSTAYFIADLIDCIVRKDLMWGTHASISLILNVGTGTSTAHRKLRSLSKGFLTEASTPFLNHWKATKTKKDFVVFVLAFTIVRILWVPYFVYRSYAIHLKRIDIMLWPSILFMILQFAWYQKMCRMVFNYKYPTDSKVTISSNKNGNSKESKSTSVKRGQRSKKED